MPASDRVTIQLIGEISVRCDDRVVDPRIIGGPRCSDTLAYLTVNRHRDIPLDEIGSILWPNIRPQSWNSTVRTVISKVRATLEAANVPGDCMRSRRGHIQFVLPESVRVDLESIRTVCHSDDETNWVRADLAQAAHRALAGPVLRGVTGDWADAVRTECEQLRLQALDIDGQSSYELDALDRSVSCAELLINLDPLRERAYRLAMRGYLGLGDRGQALDVAARCRDALSRELGVDPSPETEQLFLEALRTETASVTTAPGESFDGPDSGGSSEVLVSLERELDIIASACEKAAGGVGQCVVVTGDAGLGKTTLISEAIDRAQALHYNVLFGRCSEDAIIAFEPFVEAAGRELDAMGVAQARRWLSENGSDILRLIPHVADRFDDLAPVESAGDDRSQMVAAVHQWLTAPSRSVPTLLFIDDLHWASSATHSLLRYLLQACSTRPVCFVLTARTHALDDRDLNTTLNTATRLGGVHRIALSEFTVDDVRELASTLGSNLDPAELHARTNGHPLFVTSLFAAGPADNSSTLPTSVVEFVRRAEHGLGSAAQDVLRLCVVIGMSASRSVLRLAADTIVDDAEFSEALDELLHTRLATLVESRQRPLASSRGMYLSGTIDDTVALRHPLVQEVVYADISPGKRATLHSRVGHALAQRGIHTEPEDYARVSYHLSRGLTTDRHRAAVFAGRAGEQAFALGAYEDALAHYLYAAEQVPDGEDSDRHCRMLIGIGRARRALRDPGARAAALAAVAMARRLGDRALQVDAVLASGRRGIEFVQRYEVDNERVDVIDAICTDMTQTGQDSSAGFATLLSQLVIEHAWDDSRSDRDRMLEQAAGIARRLGDGPLLANVCVAALIGLRIPHSHNMTTAALRELNSLVESHAGALPDVTTVVWLSRARLEEGDLIGARSALDTITDAHIDGDPELDWLVKYGRLGVDLAAGRLDQAQEQLMQIRAIPPSPVDTGYYGRLLPALTALGTLRGSLQEVVDQSALMRAHFDTNHTLRPALAVALLDVGERDGAAELLEWYTPERIAGIPVDPMWLSTVTLIARAAADLSAAELCEQLYKRLVDHADCTVLTWASLYGVVHHHLAHLALGFGDLPRAGYHVTDAQQIHADRGFSGWQAESNYLGLRIDAARGALDQAQVARVRAQAAQIGATAVVRRIDALLSGQP